MLDSPKVNLSEVCVHPEPQSFCGHGGRYGCNFCRQDIAFCFPTRTLFLYQMAWSTADRIKAVKLYYREGSVVGAQRAFRRELQRRTALERRALLRWLADFEEKGTVATSHTPLAEGQPGCGGGSEASHSTKPRAFCAEVISAAC